MHLKEKNPQVRFVGKTENSVDSVFTLRNRTMAGNRDAHQNVTWTDTTGGGTNQQSSESGKMGGKASSLKAEVI